MSESRQEVVELVQQMIRNACVNEGSPESGQEVRTADLLQGYLEGPGLDVERFEAAPGRVSLVARIEGSDPAAPRLLLMGHTDVVPADPERWRHDPFGGELIEGEVWGRGAIDMLNLTGSMAVAVRRLARRGFRPRGTLIYLAVADEEAGGTYGAGYLTRHHPEAVQAEWVITEAGGMPLPSPGGLRLPVAVGERGLCWSRLRVRGQPSHGSMPYGADNALVKAAEVVRRIAAFRPPTRIEETWRAFVEGLGLPPELSGPLLRAEGFEEALGSLPTGLARLAYCCTHTTMAPTVMRVGTKVNVIPGTVDIELDVRTLPGDGVEEVQKMLAEALGDLIDDVEFLPGPHHPATSSPTHTPLWAAMERAARRFYPEAQLVPMPVPGATDARFFRDLGAAAYGFGIFSPRLGLDELARMGHGDDERVDVESLEMATELWEGLAQDVLG